MQIIHYPGFCSDFVLLNCTAMHSKKIIIAVPAESFDQGIFNLISEILTGDDISLTLNVYEAVGKMETVLEKLEKLSKICVSKSITLRIQILKVEALARLSHRSLFADLIVMHRDLLNQPHFVKAYGKVSSPILILPPAFTTINHVVLTSDGTPESVHSIKQFTQLFAAQVKHTNVTLVYLMDDLLESSDEILLVDYLKGFFKELGVLKSIKPISEKELKLIKYDDNTLVVSSCTSLLCYYESKEKERSQMDKDAIVFLAPQV